MLEILALILAVLAAISAYIVPAYFARLKPGYSHLRHTISELGESGSPIGMRVSYLGFVLIGLLVWAYLGVTALVLPGNASGPLGFLALVGLGYVGGGVFRCDAGAPFLGSISNVLHNIFGAGEYLGAAAAFSLLRSNGYWSSLSDVLLFASGTIVFCLWGISFPHPFRGLVQRVAESLIFGGIALMGWWVYREST